MRAIHVILPFLRVSAEYLAWIQPDTSYIQTSKIFPTAQNLNTTRILSHLEISNPVDGYLLGFNQSLVLTSKTGQIYSYLSWPVDQHQQHECSIYNRNYLLDCYNLVTKIYQKSQNPLSQLNSKLGKSKSIYTACGSYASKPICRDFFILPSKILTWVEPEPKQDNTIQKTDRIGKLSTSQTFAKNIDGVDFSATTVYNLKTSQNFAKFQIFTGLSSKFKNFEISEYDDQPNFDIQFIEILSFLHQGSSFLFYNQHGVGKFLQMPLVTSEKIATQNTKFNCRHPETGIVSKKLISVSEVFTSSGERFFVAGFTLDKNLENLISASILCLYKVSDLFDEPQAEISPRKVLWESTFLHNQANYERLVSFSMEHQDQVAGNALLFWLTTDRHILYRLALNFETFEVQMLEKVDLKRHLDINCLQQDIVVSQTDQADEILLKNQLCYVTLPKTNCQRHNNCLDVCALEPRCHTDQFRFTCEVSPWNKWKGTKSLDFQACVRPVENFENYSDFIPVWNEMEVPAMEVQPEIIVEQIDRRIATEATEIDLAKWVWPGISMMALFLGLIFGCCCRSSPSKISTSQTPLNQTQSSYFNQSVSSAAQAHLPAKLPKLVTTPLKINTNVSKSVNNLLQQQRILHFPEENVYHCQTLKPHKSNRIVKPLPPSRYGSVQTVNVSRPDLRKSLLRCNMPEIYM